MARRRTTVPAYERTSNGRARVRYYDADGNRVEKKLPGDYGSEVSRAGYARIIEQLATGKRTVPKTQPAQDHTIDELAHRYTEHAKIYYVDPITKEPTSEQAGVEEALRPLVRLYGDLPVSKFDSLCLETIQEAMATGSTLTAKERQLKGRRPLGLARTTINRHIDRIKRIMRWGCAKKIVPPDNLVNIQAVASLKAGRCSARETEVVKPVDLEIVAQRLLFMAPVPADMVRVMLLCGCHVGELCRLTGAQLDRSRAEWVYRPARHKTARRGKIRNIVFGPQAQAILVKYLKADPDAFLFSPIEANRRWMESKRALRKTSVQPSQADRSNPNAARKPRACYNRHTVNHAIQRGCVRAKVEPWHTHRLRHSASLNVLREFGPEGARSTLGHSTLNMALFYAGVDLEKAKEVAKKIG